MSHAMQQYTWGSPWGCPDPRLSRVVAELGDTRWVGTPHYGPCFLLQRLDGWWGGGAVTGGPVPFPAGDGGVHGDVFFHGRVVTLRGKILTDNGAQQFDAFDELAAIFASTRQRTLIVEEPERDTTRTLTVAPVTLPQPQPLSDTIADVSLTVESDGYPLLDLLTQSAVLTPGEGSQIQNIGTMEADLHGTLYGPLVEPAVTVGNTTWKYQSTIPAGERRVVDFSRRRVVDPATGTPSRIFATHGWPSVPPGQSRLAMGGSGAGRGDFSWRSTWA